MWDTESDYGPSIIQRVYGDGSDDNDGGANIDGSIFRSLIMNPPMMGTADDEILWAHQMLNAFGHVNTLTSDKSVFIDLVHMGREGRVIADGLCRRGLLGKMRLTTDDWNMILQRLLVGFPTMAAFPPCSLTYWKPVPIHTLNSVRFPPTLLRPSTLVSSPK